MAPEGRNESDGCLDILRALVMGDHLFLELSQCGEVVRRLMTTWSTRHGGIFGEWRNVFNDLECARFPAEGNRAVDFIAQYTIILDIGCVVIQRKEK